MTKFLKVEDLKEGDLICTLNKKGQDHSYRDEILSFMYVDTLHSQEKIIYARRMKVDPFNKELSLLETDNFLSTIDLEGSKWGFLRYEGILKQKNND